jgi:hypothetical protein
LTIFVFQNTPICSFAPKSRSNPAQIAQPTHLSGKSAAPPRHHDLALGNVIK